MQPITNVRVTEDFVHRCEFVNDLLSLLLPVNCSVPGNSTFVQCKRPVTPVPSTGADSDVSLVFRGP